MNILFGRLRRKLGLFFLGIGLSYNLSYSSGFEDESVSDIVDSSVKKCICASWCITATVAVVIIGTVVYKHFGNDITNYVRNKQRVRAYKQFSSLSKSFDIKECMRLFVEELKKIRGQERIKRKITFLLEAILRDIWKDLHKKQKRNEVIKRNDAIGPHLFYLTGGSGVGKTSMAFAIIKSIGSVGFPFILRPGDFTTEDESFHTQIFKGERIGSTGYRKISSFVAYVKACEAKKTIPIIFIDEVADFYDKFADPSKQINPVESVLQLIIDAKGFYYNKKFYDLSNSIFIFNSNEVVEGREDKDKTRVPISHKRAFLNRIDVIDFDLLEFKNYKEIIYDKFALAEKEYPNIKLLYDDSLVDIFAKECDKKQKGARSVEEYLRTFKSKIEDVIEQNESKAKIIYDEKIDEILVIPIRK